jgi:hypothetical protein
VQQQVSAISSRWLTLQRAITDVGRSGGVVDADACAAVDIREARRCPFDAGICPKSRSRAAVSRIDRNWRRESWRALRGNAETDDVRLLLLLRGAAILKTNG